jgi:hypothetical protein
MSGSIDHAGTTGRRRLLLGALGIVATVPLRPWRWVVAVAQPPPLAHRLVRVISHPERAAAVGAVALAGPLGPQRASTLVDAIAAGIPGGRARLERASRDELAAVVRQRIAADYAEVAVLVVDGWVVASTEARLHALAAVVDDG